MCFKLKPCPFCDNGADAYIDFKDGAPHIRVGCIGCNMMFSQTATVPAHRPVTIMEIDIILMHLAKQWNNRPAQGISESGPTTAAGTAESSGNDYEWLKREDGYVCNNCDFVTEHTYKRCPRCGQYMRNGVDELD